MIQVKNNAIWPETGAVGIKSTSFIAGYSYKPHSPTCVMWSSQITTATASLTSLARESDNNSYIFSWRSCLSIYVFFLFLFFPLFIPLIVSDPASLGN